ncbi:MAG: precorrin-6y C5,15-methyltransferase (decarboxylating) subunit CbiE [Clostridia bacterium]|nr:precorrin-6y C5,15-methyltransferase (decarboxylating) subunit CbiE [Clostridia bacterium]
MQQKRSSEQVGILVSGDPGFYSLLAYLKKHLSPEKLEVIPGISSLQVAFSRLRLTWQDALWLSLHGRPLENLLPYLTSKKTLGLLVDKNCSLGEIVRMLNIAGIWRIHVCGNLTYPDEFILTFNSQEKVPRVDLENCVLVVEPDGEK